MWNVSEYYLEALSLPHAHTSWAEVYFDLPSGLEIYRDVEIVSGSVKADATAEIRYSGDVTLNFEIESMSDLPTDILNVYTTRIALFTSIPGVRTITSRGDYGPDEVIPLGMYRIESTDRTDLDLVKLSLGGLEGYVVDDKFINPETVLDGSETIIEKVTTLIHHSLPSVEIVVDSKNPKLKESMKHTEPIGGSRWEAVMYLAESAECVVYAGPDGKFHIKDTPSKILRYTQFNADWTVQQGKHGVLTTLGTSVTRDSVYNCVVAHNNSVSDGARPWWGIAQELDPDSPIYWDGPFGKKPKFINNSNWESDLECTWAAVYELNDAFGANRTVKFGTIPNYALEPYDTVDIETISGGIEQHLITSLSFSLTHDGAVSAETKAKSEMKYLVWDDIPGSTPQHPQKLYIWSHQTKKWEDIKYRRDLTP